MRLSADDFVVPRLPFVVGVWTTAGEPLFLTRLEARGYRFIFTERGPWMPPGGLQACRYDGNVTETDWLIADLAGVWEPVHA